ncbi:hypothetical protein KJ359_007173 [Pestalotiopsis sp. 9143b]|nr:hypothetical protein KJ359_007173 [Pestalotiopsis sp. 9143b]
MRNLCSSRFSSLAFVLAALHNGQAVHALDEDAFDPLTYVDPLIGTANYGNVFPGATLPFGIAKAVADTTSDSNQGGFTLDGTPVSGFSAFHDSGTGGSPSLGNFPLFPYTSCPGNDIDKCKFPKKERVQYGNFRNDSVVSRPGYFGITLDSGIQAEMTAAHSTALFRFTFSDSSSGNGSFPLILQDLTDLSNSRQDNATVTVDAGIGRISGSGVFKPSFGVGTYTAYFCTDFSGPSIHDSGIFVNSRATTETQELKINSGINGYPLPGGAFVRFEDSDTPVLARVGLSFISVSKACSNAEAEIPDFDFDTIETTATDVWREKLSPITVSTGGGVDQSLVTSFYSGIYRTMVNPQNYTGENPKWDHGEPYFDSFYCLWDSFRSQLPFLTILDPSSVAQMIRSLIDTYRVEGWLPDCHMSFCNGYTQGGSNADVVLADAFVKGLTDNIDHFQNTVVAEGLNKSSDAQKYLSSSQNWKNIYNPIRTSLLFTGQDTGFVGFFQPKYLNQTWGDQDPLYCSNIDTTPNPPYTCSLQITSLETFESSIWEYGFFVPHDQADLMTSYGGPQEFVRRLNYLHDQNITGIGNEPSFLTVFQYHYAGRPALSALRSHFYIPRYFNTAPGGLPGNDDGGAMGSFLAFSTMGLFPNPGQNVYLITPPYFESVSIKSPITGNTATIRNVNFDPSYEAIYIQSATLDGEPYTKNWIDHSFFTEGKELILTLGKNESSWGTAVKDLPPSISDYTGFNGTYSARPRALKSRFSRNLAAGASLGGWA